ncbi:hypothetical protein DSO57_1027303 [Entomophthora muscae]|uniref:Uncharacterized protein n=1 Tax=Entomophthora muscae TaxID=34485 RepID=A0ACC2RGP5_9FUNG|nr:hypothetical protein DSO57_1027303 [Entomophthora muscae]
MSVVEAREVFAKYGGIVLVDFVDDVFTRRFSGNAIICFRGRYREALTRYPLTIRGRRISFEKKKKDWGFERSRFELGHDHQFQYTRLEAGNLIEDGFFSREFSSQKKKGFEKICIDCKARRVLIFMKYNKMVLKLSLGFVDILDKVWIEDNEFRKIINFQIKQACSVWILEKNFNTSSKDCWMQKDVWKRVSFYSFLRTIKSGKLDVSFGKDSIQGIGSWFFWRVHLCSANSHSFEVRFKSMVKDMSSYNMMAPISQTKTIQLMQCRQSTSWALAVYSLPFEVAYSVECVISYNLISIKQITLEFIEILNTVAPFKIRKICEKIWYSQIKVLDIIGYFRAELNQPIFNETNTYFFPAHVLIPKIIVTPLKIYILPKGIEVTNRVIRHFHSVSDRFLRVTFAEEDFGKLYTNSEENKDLRSHISTVLRNGINIANRHYKFLVFSASQLRSHGCWFFSENEHVGIDDIHNWMGDFDEIKNAAKYAARMGQCFSSSTDGITLDLADYEEIPDVVNNEAVFSDGVGRISYSLARSIASKLGLRSIPSAVQFRMGGYKGVLSVWPNLKCQAQLRPSQKKFHSKHCILEILNIASFSPSYLNRQIITLLSSLGVPDSVFMRLQSEMIKEISSMKSCPRGAVKVLSSHSENLEFSCNFIDLIKAGFLCSADNFVKNCIDILYVFILNELKSRARILVQKGAMLMGILDETGTLQENEIFVQCTNPDSIQKYQIINEECIVTRNPCFHPGDIRIVQAVDNPNLHHIVDCVVFPANGNVNIPNMCSGGDLDGDLFTVIWNKDLIPPIKNYRPMSFEKIGRLPEKNVTLDDIKCFFVDYITNDSLGKIANSHLARADYTYEGAFSSDCLRLAQLHSCAVDFPKTGIPAEIDLNLKVRHFPDFMQKPGHMTYKSTKVQGLLYRSIDYVAHEPNESLLDEAMIVPGFESYIDEALELKQEYDKLMKSLMNQYEVRTELEIVCGCKLDGTSFFRKNKFAINREIKEKYATVKKDLLGKFYAKSTKDPPLSLALRQKASAWYIVTYYPCYRSGNGLVSFPWILSHHLIEIRCLYFNKPYTCKASFPELTKTNKNNVKTQTTTTNYSLKSLQADTLTDMIEYLESSI